MGRNRAKFLPSEIRFSHDDIKHEFKDGTSIQYTLKQLKTGAITIDDIPKIKIVKRDGLKFSVNNRRLWVFKRYEEFLRSRGETIAIPVTYGAHTNLTDYRLSTRNEGMSVKIRLRERSDKRIRLRSSDIRYSSDAIYFSDRKDGSLSDILETLESGFYKINTLPKVTVVQKKGIFYAINNERVLWAIKQYSEKHARDITLTCSLGRYSDLRPTSFTTKTDGLSVHVLSGYPDEKRKIKQDKCLDDSIPDVQNLYDYAVTGGALSSAWMFDRKILNTMRHFLSSKSFISEIQISGCFKSICI
ncbi:uncharacterized protein LOC123561161 [Mercenaria mercenaria]|uniref:uncharacterized protein LOC123561161 n=1 Tax=Mercenaria mercenaria TaxID=6596 RepID=UPI00234E954B|nr:uncharacterized protein LOC123561161 [Mercenaria mercenaria]XP_053381034.1 uncharacterized protein LOC123561161 [Mercenaria mercenaria]XP_053381035.1 uncharacterized protein LOC123561161 [Mercenaria mercenaria]